MLISTNANLGLLSQLSLKQNRRGTSPTSHVARVSYLLYALFYWVFDILGLRRGTGLIALFGRHSLLAYMCIETTCRSVLWVAAATHRFLQVVVSFFLVAGDGHAEPGEEIGAPLVHRVYDRNSRLAKAGQGVFGLGRNDGIDLA